MHDSIKFGSGLLLFKKQGSTLVYVTVTDHCFVLGTVSRFCNSVQLLFVSLMIIPWVLWVVPLLEGVSSNRSKLFQHRCVTILASVVSCGWDQ